ncbi:transposase [Marinobacterium sp. xm-a-152]|jgi:transposase|uniref:transposase n=1 Tax=Marinobacterium sp. xm-a-152 TaxID=2497733 RepID=UPI00156A649B|nr:transposase [Marinobacterium sp. xm-a-152]NRP16784.1 Transposase [Marinobacterium sp. xm-a-152]
MSRYNRVFKLQLAKLCETQSSASLSQEYGVSARQIRYWSQVFRIHGENSFLHIGKPYSSAFKLKALKKMHDQNWSISYTSVYFDLSSAAILLQWKKLYDSGEVTKFIPQKKGSQPMNKPTPKPADQMTEKELREELKYLRAENDVLKKLKALAQAKQEQQEKKQSS